MRPGLSPRLVQHYQPALQALQKQRNLFPLLDQLKIQVGQVRMLQQRHEDGYQLLPMFQLLARARVPLTKVQRRLHYLGQGFRAPAESVQQ